ncbi:MAG: aminopeptidase P family protein [Chloroflexi bacterium]|nr:aminopeptidase P family protein [Chloroflexota bacterium]
MTSPHSSQNVLKRQALLKDLLEQSALDALVLNAGKSLTYLTGLEFHLMERPTIFLSTADGKTAFVLPELEKGKLSNLGYATHAFTYSEDPARWGESFAAAAQALDLKAAQLGVETTVLRVLELRYLEAAMPDSTFLDGAELLTALRGRKDGAEVAAMQRAAEIAEDALLATQPKIKVGMSEKEIAAILVQELLSHGSDSELPFFPIVASGPNSANPHSTISERKIREGDLLLIDWGAAADGYFSDITRTFAVGEIDEELQRIHSVVELANAAGRAAVHPGAPAEAVDQAAREAIEDSGYGQYFVHRTGHGLGLEPHETPYIRAGNRAPLEVGNAFTVEPGIYLEGRGGVRIEDNIVVTEDGALCLTKLPRGLQTLG